MVLVFSNSTHQIWKQESYLKAETEVNLILTPSLLPAVGFEKTRIYDISLQNL